jgi:hypothetical protein
MPRFIENLSVIFQSSWKKNELAQCRWSTSHTFERWKSDT